MAYSQGNAAIGRPVRSGAYASLLVLSGPGVLMNVGALNHSYFRQLPRVLLALVLFVVASATLYSQDPAPTTVPPANPSPSTGGPQSGSSTPKAPAQPPQANPTAKSEGKTEVSIQDSGTTFHLRVNLVQVHVVVRDARGNPSKTFARKTFFCTIRGNCRPSAHLPWKRCKLVVKKPKPLPKLRLKMPSSLARSPLPRCPIAL